jgi:hypothetical protein
MTRGQQASTTVALQRAPSGVTGFKLHNLVRPCTAPPGENWARVISPWSGPLPVPERPLHHRATALERLDRHATQIDWPLPRRRAISAADAGTSATIATRSQSPRSRVVARKASASGGTYGMRA